MADAVLGDSDREVGSGGVSARIVAVGTGGVDWVIHVGILEEAAHV